MQIVANLSSLALYLFFSTTNLANALTTFKSILHPGMDNHGLYLPPAYSFFSFGLGMYLLVGQKKGGFNADDDFLGLALSVSGSLLEDAPGGKKKNTLEPTGSDSSQPSIADRYPGSFQTAQALKVDL